MNPVDTATLPLASPATTATEVASSAQSASNTTAPASASPLTQELAVMQASSQVVPAAATTTSALQKVMEALVTVVQALVGVVTALISGGRVATAGVSQGGADTSSPSSSNSSPSSGTTTSPSSSNNLAGSTASSQTSNPSLFSTGAGGGIQQLSASQANRSLFEVTRNDIGQISVRTLDGFLVRAEGKDEAWTITGPDGKTTRIWGDPHVKESDGNKWDFLNRSTFQFGNNKATVEVVPAGNGTTLTSRITIYSGSERVTIDGIDKNKPNVVAVSSDGKQHDDSLADGITYKRSATGTGEAWTSNLTGKVM